MPSKAIPSYDEGTYDQELPGFDVTCKVGRVTFDPTSRISPTEAAMAMIGHHDAPGQYEFPHPDGRIITVMVEW